MDHVFLRGRGYYLRALEEKDLDGEYFQWLNDEKVCEFNSHATFPNTRKRMVEYFESTQDTRDAVVLAIIDEANGKHVGNVSLQQIDWVNRSAEFAILLGASECWGKGVGHLVGKLLLEYGFVRLNLYRIYCGTTAGNVGMQKLAEKLGMVREGTRRNAVYKSGKYADVYEYGVLRNEFCTKM